MISLQSLPWRTFSSSLHIESDEELNVAFDTHWIKYIVPSLIAFIFALMTIGILYSSLFIVTGPFASVLFTFGSCLFLLNVHWLFYKLLSEGMQDVIITNKRLIYLETRLWVQDSIHEVRLNVIRAVEANKTGILQNLLRYGSIWFDTGGSSKESGTIIPLVPHPQDKVRQILQTLKMR